MVYVSPVVLIAAIALAGAGEVRASDPRAGFHDTHANRLTEPYASYRDTRNGAVRSLQSIEAGVVPNMKRQGASYIGAEYNAQSLQYRLKFMNDGSVIWIDVDGRSGAVVGQAGQ
jgi:hypothetical protein